MLLRDPCRPHLACCLPHNTNTHHQPPTTKSNHIAAKACAAYLSFIVGMIVQLAPAWGEDRILLGFCPLLVLLSW